MKGTSLQHQLQKLLMVANLHQQLRWFNQIILSNSKMVSFTYLARIIFWTAHIYINSSNIIFSNRSNRKQIKWDNHKHYDNGNDDAFIWHILLFNMLRSTLQRFVGNFGQIALRSFQFFEIKLFTYSRILETRPETTIPGATVPPHGFAKSARVSPTSTEKQKGPTFIVITQGDYNI